MDVPYPQREYDPDPLRCCFTATAPRDPRHRILGDEGQLFGTQRVVEYQEEARLGGVRIHTDPTYEHSGATGIWTPSALPPGQALCQPAPLLRKLDEGMMEEAYARLAG